MNEELVRLGQFKRSQASLAESALTIPGPFWSQPNSSFAGLARLIYTHSLSFSYQTNQEQQVSCPNVLSNPIGANAQRRMVFSRE
jgi:hypothetical protein